jgi:hypothetical protein
MKVEIGEPVALARVRYAASRRPQIEREVAELQERMPHLKKAADKEWTSGYATRALETAQEDRARLLRELRQLG